MDDKMYWYWFCAMVQFSMRRQHQLMDMLHHPKELFSLKESVLGELLTPGEIAKLLKQKDMDEIKCGYDQILESDSRFIFYKEGAYPEKLKEIYDYPYGIFQQGKPLKKSPLSIAVVGSRRPTTYSIELTKVLVKDLSAQGVAVVSGMAKGVDGIAHWSAIDSMGTTVGVLGCGIDMIYPQDNYYLFEEMKEKQTILSEYPPQTPPRAFRFPERNRIISGMCDGVLVIEAKKESGSLITATCALEQNREVFAIPGPIDKDNYGGSNLLIKQGAKLVDNVADILDEFPEFIKLSENKEGFLPKNLAVIEKKVYHSLDLTPKHIDEIGYITALSPQEVLQALFHLEQMGYIKQVHHNNYIKNSDKR